MYETMLRPAARARRTLDIPVTSDSQIAEVRGAAFKVAREENCNAQVDETDRRKVRVVFTAHPTQW